MLMSKKPSWYGVRTLYRLEPVGRPQGTDRLYSDRVTGVEERVVVVRARSGKEAIRKGEAEARKYAADSFHNPYGQRVRTRRLDYIDAYDINEPLVEGAEVFSEVEIVSRSVPDRDIIRRLIGRPESDRVFASRRNIHDIAFMKPAPGVKRNRKDQKLFDSVQAQLRRRDA
jgi:hypothetical protein